MSSVSTSNKHLRDLRAWTAATAGNPSDWRRQLPAELVAALRQIVTRLPPEQALTDLRLDNHARAWGMEHLAPARHDLEHGLGFTILERLPLAELSQREAVAMYWLLGQLLGEPIVQNVQGTLLYDVRDTGQDLTSGARFSVTNYESSFHTDNSFGDTVLDYVGLLCLHTAKSGGISQNVSGYGVQNVLRSEHPEVLEALCQPWHVDRRGGFHKGESSTVRRPIIQQNGGDLVFRYLRYWIEVGHDKAGEPLTDQQRQALDVLDGLLSRQEMRVEFALEPGHVYFINNRWILHNRTAFNDHAEPEKRRHLVRLWLRAGTA